MNVYQVLNAQGRKAQMRNVTQRKPDVYWKIHAGSKQMILRNAALETQEPNKVQESRGKVLGNRQTRSQNTGINSKTECDTARHQMRQLRDSRGTDARRLGQNNKAVP